MADPASDNAAPGFAIDNLPARHTYTYLVTFKQLSVTYDEAAKVQIQDLTYWNQTDPDSSKEKGALFAWGLHQSCIQSAALWGTEFKGSAEEHAKLMSGLVSIMQTPTMHVANMADTLGKLFSFKS